MSGSTFLRSGSVGIQQRCLVQQLPPSQQLQPQRQHMQSQRQQQQQFSSQQSDVGDACRYLYRHCVHSKVENIFSSVLNDRPEDPLLYIVEYLHNKVRKPVVQEEEPLNTENSTTNMTICRRDTQQPSDFAPVQRETVMEESRGDTSNMHSNDIVVHWEKGGKEEGCGEEKMLVGEEEVPQLSLTVPVSPLMPICVSNKLMTVSTEPFVQPMQASFGSMRPVVSLMRPSSSLLATRTSVRNNSRNETLHASTNNRFGSAMAETQLCGVGATSLDRDDSTRSDLSTLSLASIDIQDFLQEFRSAKADCVGVEIRLLDIEMVSDILQHVNIPLPDIPLIAELFDDVRKISDLRYNTSGVLDDDRNNNKKDISPATTKPTTLSSFTTEVGSRERVYFDAFLARMAFMIQGRYPTELIRSTFYSILESAVKQKCPADGAVRQCRHEKMQQQGPLQQQQQQQSQPKGTEEEGQYTRLSSGNAFGKSARATNKNPCRSNSSVSLSNNGNGPATAMHTYPGVSLQKSALCAAPNESHSSVELSTLLHGVPLAICVEEGLWRGLGIPVSRAEVMSALRILGIPADDSYEFHVNDFVRLVMALTGQSSLHSVGDRGSLWMVPSLGRENSIVPFNGSLREDGT